MLSRLSGDAKWEAEEGTRGDAEIRVDSVLQVDIQSLILELQRQ